MSKSVIITITLETIINEGETAKEVVYAYLKDLMEDGTLDFEAKAKGGTNE